MVDKPTTSRVGRPRSRSASQNTKRCSQSRQTQVKIYTKTQIYRSSKKTAAPTIRAVRPILEFEWYAVQANQKQFGDQLPDLLPLDIEQDNIPLNPCNQPQDLPAGEENQQIEEPNLSPEPEELEQPNMPPNQFIQPNQPNHQIQPNPPPNQVQNLPVAMGHLQQLNWSYFKPEFSGKPEEDAEETSSQHQ